MTETVLSSATREVAIGFERPFVIIGERINPTGRSKLAEEMKNGNFDTVVADAIAQVEAGAHMLDVNAGIPLADEPAILAEAIQLVQSVTDVPLCIDSSIVEALEAGLSVYEGKALVNSVTGEEERLESVLPLVARHGAAVVAITNDENGISEDSDERFEIARKIVERAAEHGIPKEDIVIDPLVMPIGAIGSAGRQVFRPRPPAARGARREHDLRRVQHQLRPSEPTRPERRVPAHGDRVRPHVRDHEPAARGGSKRDQGGRRDDGARRALRDLDRGPGRDAVGGAARPPRRSRGSEESNGVSDTEHLVVFTPSGRRGRFERGTTVLEAARRLGVDLDSVCGGRGICGRCQVAVDEGEHAKHGITSAPPRISPR